MEKPFVSIIIPTKNSASVLEDCLKSLKKQDYPKKRYEIIIGDDHSKDKTIEIAKKYGAKIVKSSRPPGRQRNDAIASARGSILGFIDSDCVAMKDWISGGVKNFLDEDTAIVGGPNFTHPHDPFIAQCAGYVFSSRAGSAAMSARYTSKGKNIKETDETGLISCNMFMKKRVFDKVGGFQTDFFPNEENDLMYRVKKIGYKLLYIPRMVVWHHRRSTLKGFFMQDLWYGISRSQLVKKHPHVLKIFHLFPSAFVSFILLGPILSLMLPHLWFLYIAFFGFYFASMILLGFYKAVKLGDARIAVVLPLMFFILHVAYGIGFILGLFK
jgi:glycosyltransferase involved in cell wall biosynthesis